MFEMFALLINLLILTISEAMVTYYLFFLHLHVWSSATQRITHQHLLYYIFENLSWEFAARNCRGYLPREFAVEICRRNCRGYLPQEFSVEISPNNFPWLFVVGFFVFVSKSFFVYVRKSCLYESKTFFICEQNVFICEIFFINSVSFCYCRGSYGPPYKTFLGYCTNIETDENSFAV